MREIFPPGIRGGDNFFRLLKCEGRELFSPSSNEGKGVLEPSHSCIEITIHVLFCPGTLPLALHPRFNFPIERGPIHYSKMKSQKKETKQRNSSIFSRICSHGTQLVHHPSAQELVILKKLGKTR